jgi:UDP-glucose 4-epimerase
MRILITGCGGFIGGSIGRFAASAAGGGHEVLGLARRTQPDRDWLGRYAALDVAHADLAPVIAEFNPDMIFHGAGSASVGRSLSHPMDDLRASLLPWANLLDGVRRSGLHPLVMFPSSAAVYGNPATLPVREDAPVAPISPYGYHKAACELLARQYAECFGLRISVCRLFSVFGPAQRRLLVWELFEQFARGDAIVWLQGTGDETRDFIHVDDLAALVLWLAAEANTSQRPAAASGCRFINVATGQETTTRGLAEALRDLVVDGGEVGEIRCRGVVRPGDPRNWRADTTLLRALKPAWQPRAFRQALGHCVREWRGAGL